MVGTEWEKLPEPRPSLSLEIVIRTTASRCSSTWVRIRRGSGREDVELVHQLWLELSAKEPGAKLHHRDLVGVALRRMKDQLESPNGQGVVEDVMRELANGNAESETGSKLVDSY